VPRTLLLITDLELGGTPTVVRELAVRLPRRGHDIEVACLSKWGPVADQISAAGVPVTALNAAGVRDVGLFRRTIRLIRDTSDTLSAIAARCGYYDQAYLTRTFRKYTGVTPAEYRRRHTYPAR
jgi:AraC-like DNA-binding protein